MFLLQVAVKSFDAAPNILHFLRRLLVTHPVCLRPSDVTTEDKSPSPFLPPSSPELKQNIFHMKTSHRQLSGLYKVVSRICCCYFCSTDKRRKVWDFSYLPERGSIKLEAVILFPLLLGGLYGRDSL